MKLFNSLPLASTAALGMLLTFTTATFAQAPQGTYEKQISDPQNAVWDLTALSDLGEDFSFEIEGDDTSLDISFPIELTLTGSGKFVGSGSTTVSMDISDPENGETPFDFPATYKASGSITSSQGVGKVKFSVTVTGTGYLEGANRRLSATHSVSVTVYNKPGFVTTTGTSKSKASASGLGSLSGSDSWGPEDNYDFGDGGWQLSMNLQSDGKKVTGTAEVTLHTERAYEFSAKGSYNSKTGLTKLVLKGLGEAKGSNLTVNIGANNSITSLKGKLFGQMVDAAF